MKGLSDNAFFRAFDSIVDAANPGLKRRTWDHGGAHWRRERYSVQGADHSFVVEAFTVVHAARAKWRLLVVKEHWWSEDGEPLKSLRWTRPAAGRRADMLSWFRKEAAAIEPARCAPIMRPGS